MCTVTFLPKGKQGFILTSNRDESILRQAVPPEKHLIGNNPVFYPQDTIAGGTWFATGSHYTLCILNGAFVPHERKLPYRKSRGLVVKEFFEYNDAIQFAGEYDFGGIEPFTLVIIHHSDEVTIYELRWDGKEKHFHATDATQPQIWGSVSLYTPEVIAQRKALFEEWLKEHGEYRQEDIIEFHEYKNGKDKENGLVISRFNGILKTVSISSAEANSGKVLMKYHDLLTDKQYSYSIHED
jgi:uncharacterized protein with NRDE domain